MAKSRSIDPFTKVGGIALDKEGRIRAVGYNGLKSKFKAPDWMFLPENRDKKSDIFIHCETNICALLTKGECHTLCLTHSPCIKCCQNIAALDVKRVIYLKEYDKCNKFKEFFDFYNIEYQELAAESKRKILNYLMEMSNFFELI